MRVFVLYFDTAAVQLPHRKFSGNMSRNDFQGDTTGAAAGRGGIGAR